MDAKRFPPELWAEMAEVIFQGFELSEYERILHAEERNAIRENQMILPAGHEGDFMAMFFNRYERIKAQVQGRQAAVNTLAILLKALVTCSGDPAVGSTFRVTMMDYLSHREEVFQKAARTLVGDYMEPRDN